MSDETRSRILQVALQRFAANGYHATSVQQIADDVGITKAAVLYHFKEKIDLLAELAAPLLDALEASVVAAEALEDPAEARWTMITGLLEVLLAHRYLLRMNLQDLALTTGPQFARFREAMLRAILRVAGPEPDFAGQVRASQTVAMLSDPVVLFADQADALRPLILANVRKLYSPQELPGPAPRSRRGRPPVLDEAMLREAQRLRRAGRSAAEIAAALGVSRATLYRHLGPL